MAAVIERRITLSRAKSTEVIEWYAEETWVGGVANVEPSSRVLRVYVTINAARYWEGHEKSMMRAYDMACQLFGEGNFSGPWHDN